MWLLLIVLQFTKTKPKKMLIVYPLIGLLITKSLAMDIFADLLQETNKKLKDKTANRFFIECTF